MNTSKKTEIIEKHLVPELALPLRLQEYGVSIFKAVVSKSALKKTIKNKLIYVDATIATTATMIFGGELISLHQTIAAPKTREFRLSLEVIFEDDYLAIVNKPPGVLVSGNAFKTIANALAQNLKQSTKADATTPMPIHRLDFPTTGVLLVGKTTASIRSLNTLFEQKKINKTYYAVTIGKMNTDDSIAMPIDGKQALSNYEIIDCIKSKKFEALNLLKLDPKTGRRHQLRKHLAAIGHPILGDPDYSLKGKILKGNGLYLHAYALEFEHPVTGEKVKFLKQPPPKFVKLFDKLFS